MRKKHEWSRNENGEVVNQNGEWISGNKLSKEHTEFETDRNKCYKEKYFQEAIEFVLAKNGVEYESEYKVNSRSNSHHSQGRRADIYIPATDTAIELKISPGTRGLGQAVYYAQHHRESILITDIYKRDIAETIRSVPGVHFGTAIPGVHKDPPVLAVSSDSRCEFFHQAQYGDLGGYADWFVKKPAVPKDTNRSTRKLSDFEQGEV